MTFRSNDMRDRTRRRWLYGVLALSVVIRVAVALYLGDVVDAPSLLTDQRSYHALGARLISGHGFSFDTGWYPFTPADTPTAHWSFLYSLLVAAVYAVFGVHPLAMRLVQAILGGLLLPLAVYRLARRVFGLIQYDSVPDPGPLHNHTESGLVPLAAAAIAAVYGYFALYAATLMTETFFLTAVVWSLDVALGIADSLRYRQHVPFRQSVQLGLSLCIATLLRQSILPWVPLLLAYLLWLGLHHRRIAASVNVGLLVCGMLAAAIAPWTYRNYRVYGQFLLLNSNAGYAMYSAQHPMHGTHFREFDAAPLPEGLDWGNEAAMDRALMKQGIGFVIEDPGRYLLLSLSRVRAFFEFWPTRNTTWLHNLGRVGSFGLFLPFMLYGLSHVVRDSDRVRRNGLLLLFAGFYTVLHLLTWAMVRYRLPVDATMMPWTGWAMVDLGQRVSRALFSARSHKNKLPLIHSRFDGS